MKHELDYVLLQGILEDQTEDYLAEAESRAQTRKDITLIAFALALLALIVTSL